MMPLISFFTAVLLPVALFALDFPVHKKVLDNGLTVLLYPNTQAPTVSCRLFYVTGSVNEIPGSSGLAHILEHELFKGTKKVGVTDFHKDSILLVKQDSVMSLSREAAVRGDSLNAQKFRAEYDSLVEEERQYMVKEELWSAYQQAGGTGLNAFTTDLMTAYFVTLPKNRLELFLYLESDRMQNAILREFYSERDVVREERRMRYDDRPSGRYFETLNGMTYEAFPYRIPTIGWPSDIMNLTREQAAEHYRKYYKPRNAILVLAGDLDTASAMALVQKYFAEIPSGEAFAPITVRDPEPAGEKRLTVYRPDAPNRMDFIFKTPGVGDSSLYALDIAEGVLNGRSGRLYKKLVEEKKVAVSARAANSVNKTVSEFSISVLLQPDANPDSVEAFVWEELEKLKTETVSERELAKVKNRATMGLVESFLDMENVATQLAWYEMFGDYKILLNWPDNLGKVTPENVQNIAQKTFSHKNATIGLLLKGEER
ncbi:pitrilysin family protein [uncultured Fibrobacter sp.]|uniref:M16 family metallopeptidase n=1 Tax=uncultured Fibrobacter sp. TaxID=261512 RepID=UPI0028041A5D|nr:pitrilysin family protein [uncultured Fibrobacter sp.]